MRLWAFDKAAKPKTNTPLKLQSLKKVLGRFNGSNWIWPPLPLYIVDRSHVVNFFVGPLNIVWWGEGRDMGWRRVQATCTLLFAKRGLKLALAARKTTTKIDRASQLIFWMIVATTESKGQVCPEISHFLRGWRGIQIWVFDLEGKLHTPKRDVLQ